MRECLRAWAKDSETGETSPLHYWPASLSTSMVTIRTKKLVLNGEDKKIRKQAVRYMPSLCRLGAKGDDRPGPTERESG